MAVVADRMHTMLCRKGLALCVASGLSRGVTERSSAALGRLSLVTRSKLAPIPIAASPSMNKGLKPRLAARDPLVGFPEER
jgi:hypothetical protein